MTDSLVGAAAATERTGQSTRQSAPTTHMPPSQTSPASHGMPQPPQCSSSVMVFTQSAPHRVSAGSHIAATHMPSVQVSSASHASPQPPQFAGSVEVSTQARSQSVRSPQSAAHAPIEQTMGAAQGISQPPQ